MGLVDLMVNSSDLAALEQANIEHSLLIKDVEELIQAEKNYKPVEVREFLLLDKRTY